jgi:Sec-independent protein translocase protein TatA
MFGLSAIEMVVIVVVAILVFGPRLPQVAAEFAGWMMKLKRSLTDLRRESGIDREISEVRRAVENAVPREVRSFNVERSLQEGVQTLKKEVAEPVVKELEAVRDAATKDPTQDRKETPPDRRDDATLPQGPATVSPAETDPQAPPATTDRHP